MDLNRIQQLAGISSHHKEAIIPPTFLFEHLEDDTFLIETYQDFESLFEELNLLFEDVTLTHTQIDNLFKNVEAYLNSDKAEVSNRNVWGKSVDSIRARLRDLFNWKKGKNKVGIVKNFDKVNMGFEQQIDKSSMNDSLKPQALKILNSIKDYGNENPIAQKALVQIATSLVAVQNASSKTQQIIIPAIASQTRKLLSDQSGVTSLVELLFNEGLSNLPEQLAFLDAWNQDKTLAEFAKENAEMVKAIRKYPEKVAEATSKLVNENIICSIFTDQKGESKWDAAYTRFSSKKSKLFIWKNGIYYAGDLKDIATATFKQIKNKVGNQPDAESVGNHKVVEQLDENFITDFFGKMKDKVKSWQAKKGEANSNFTTIVTFDKIERAWVKAGKPRDITELETFLVDYLSKAYGKSHHLAIHKMLDEFFNELRDELENKKTDSVDDTAEPEESSSNTKSANDEPSSSNVKSSAPASEPANNSEPNDTESKALGSEEKSLLKQLYLAVKNGKGDIAKDLASHMHKRNVLFKALAKIYNANGIKLEENFIDNLINDLLLEDYRKKAGLQLTENSKLIKILEIELKHF